MRDVQREYGQLEQQLRSEEAERNDMMQQITECFAKLETMEAKLRAKREREGQVKQKELK